MIKERILFLFWRRQNENIFLSIHLYAGFESTNLALIVMNSCIKLHLYLTLWDYLFSGGGRIQIVHFGLWSCWQLIIHAKFHCTRLRPQTSPDSLYFCDICHQPMPPNGKELEFSCLLLSPREALVGFGEITTKSTQQLTQLRWQIVLNSSGSYFLFFLYTIWQSKPSLTKPSELKHLSNAAWFFLITDRYFSDSPQYWCNPQP